MKRMAVAYRHGANRAFLGVGRPVLSKRLQPIGKTAQKPARFSLYLAIDAYGFDKYIFIIQSHTIIYVGF